MEREGPLTAAEFRKLLARAGEESTMGLWAFPSIPTCSGTAAASSMANEGHATRAIQHYLGYKNIQHTVRYAELSSDRFKGFGKD